MFKFNLNVNLSMPLASLLHSWWIGDEISDDLLSSILQKNSKSSNTGNSVH